MLTGSVAGHPWELTIEGHLDTDYVATARLRCQVPGRAGFSASSGSGLSPTGTEADLVVAVIGAARSWWRGRGSGSGSPRTAAQARSPLTIDDPHGVLDDDIQGLLASWPASTHSRSARHADRVHAAFSAMTQTLELATENLWGEAVVDHHLLITRLIVERLLAIPAVD